MKPSGLMKKHWQEFKFIYYSFFIWRITLLLVQFAGRDWWPLQFKYLGRSPWANFDGIHYVTIATEGYHQFQQAFFPLYPVFIKLLFIIPAETAGLILSHIAFLAGLLVWYRLTKSKWTVLLLLAFPTSFFFASLYTESLFFLLGTLVFYYCDRGTYKQASIVGMLASGTRLFGILFLPYIITHAFLHKKKSDPVMFIIPLGLLVFMAYLYYSTGDPLAFIHVQPQFGANRSGGSLIFLPQVVWRYLQIFIHASKTTVSYWVAIGEFMTFIFAGLLAYVGWRNKKLRLYIAYSVCVILIPTLSGTLSSLPRYMLSAFPLLFVLGSLDNRKIKMMLIGIMGVLLVVFTSLFLQGYFIA